jgi:hypothetical protein
MFTRRALAIAVTFVACAALPASASAGISADALTLRLPDVGPNYAVETDPDCGKRIDGTDEDDFIERLAKRYGLLVCGRSFSRSWVARGDEPGARDVGSAVLLFDDVSGAIAGMEKLDSTMHGDSVRSLKSRPAPPLGDAAVAYDYMTTPCCMNPSVPSSVVIWRSGRVVGFLSTSGWTPRLAAEADRLAAIQQGRIALPTRVTPPDFDDRYVALNDPGLGASVPWLGERLAPRGLPALRFGDSYNYRGTVTLRYYRRGNIEAIEMWRPRAWSRFKRSRQGRSIFGQLCASRTVQTRNGAVRLLADNNQRPCTDRPPAHRFAVTRAGRFVAVVNGPLCSSCWDRPRRASPYESWRGLLAIARNLRPRPVPHSAN